MIAGLVLAMLASVFGNLQVHAGLLDWNLDIIFPSCLAATASSLSLLE